MNRRMITPVSSRVSARCTASSSAKTEPNGYCSVETVRGTAGRDGRAWDTSLYTSETFAFNAIETYVGSDRPLVVYALYDFDRSGADAARSLEEKLTRFASERGVDVRFNLLGLAEYQIREWRLPTRPHKRGTTADHRWPHPYACELDAIPPDDLRALVQAAIEQHLPAGELTRLKHIEDLEPIFAQAGRKLVAGGLFFVCELHPFKQYAGKQARCVGADGSAVEIPAYTHHISDYLAAARSHGLALVRLDEWWVPGGPEAGKTPQLVSALWCRSNAAMLQRKQQ